ncbi:MAG: hypothetical protein EU532_11600 [Promethearchaeota archaeon]|nr:MAG: hypothetical protein EU532_11600 [Candidatus Lokiarchaeota archaeon]
MIEFEVEEFQLNEIENGIKLLKLPELTEQEIKIIDPIVAPTSGLRIQIFDIIDENHYYLSSRKFFLFLRVAKAISEKFKIIKQNHNLKLLIVTDDRLSKDILLQYFSQIFAYDGYEIYYQEDDFGKSRVSAPYAAASVALYDDIDLVIVLTASHNDLSWNGIKFYIEYPIPMSGDLFKQISDLAINYKEIYLKTDFKPTLTDAIQRNNDYVKNILADVLEIKSLKNRNIIIWPYLGEARGIVNLFKDYGANVILINEVINPPNPIKEIREEKLQEVMTQSNSDIALLLDADRDRIALYVKQDGQYFIYIPNEIYSAMHNILAKDFNKEIINIRTIPTDLRSDGTSFMNILTGVGYKHLGVILYFLMGIEVDQSKIDTAILYMEGEEDNKELIKLQNPTPLKQKIMDLMEKQNLEQSQFITVMWEESGGHTINILNVSKNPDTKEYLFESPLPLIADKYPVPALVLITELLCRGYVISESIDWSIVGINRTIPATDEEKVKIMKNFERNHNKTIEIKDKHYSVQALSDNNNMIDIYQLKSKDSTLYFRPSGTGPEVRFYIFGKRDTYLDEIKTVMDYVKKNY